MGFMGDHQRPDLATLDLLDSTSPSGISDSGEDTVMEVRQPGGTSNPHSLVQAAQDALSAEDAAGAGARSDGRLDAVGRSRIRPKISTTSLVPRGGPLKTDDVMFPQSRSIQTDNAGIMLENRSFRMKNTSLQQSRSALKFKGEANGSHKNRSPATSPQNREASHFASDEAPMITLAAMQKSPSEDTAKSPSGQQKLPSIKAQLGTLATSLPNLDNPNHGNGSNPHARHSHSSPESSVQSPPDSGTTRTTHFPNLQTRSSGFPQHFSPMQPSPASTLSELSPRDYRGINDPTSMSPPGRPASHHQSSNGLTPSSDVQTPLSAESYQSSTSYSTDTSLQVPDRMSIDMGRPILPPLPTGGPLPLLNGGFKCNYKGCTALPFQTQYLLK